MSRGFGADLADSAKDIEQSPFLGSGPLNLSLRKRKEKVFHRIRAIFALFSFLGVAALSWADARDHEAAALNRSFSYLRKTLWDWGSTGA